MNKILKHLEKVTGRKHTNADLLNLVREYCDDSYKNDIPEMNRMTQINHNNVPYVQYAIHQNQFFSVLINRIGIVVLKALAFENPLSPFKTENFVYGETMQEIYVGLAEAQQYNPKDGISPFKYSDTDIKVFYHDINDERLFERTIEQDWTQKAFTNERSFDEFIDKMLTSLISSDTLAEFERIKQVFSLAMTEINIAPSGSPEQKVTVPAMQFDFSAPDFVLNFNKELIKRSNLFAVPSTTRFENAAGVPNATPVDEQYLIMSAEFSSELDSMLANAFNMDKATVLARKIIIDEFPKFTGGGTLDGATPFAFLISKKSLILKDKKFSMTNIYNPRGDFYNYFLHHHQLISFSLLENSRIYYTKEA